MNIAKFIYKPSMTLIPKPAKDTTVLFSCSVVSNSLWSHEPQHARFPSITNSWSLLKLMSIELVMPSNHLVLCCPFSSCLQSFPASEYFPMHQLFALGGQRIGPSASIFPMNIQHWFPLGWTGLISLQSKGLSWVFSNTTVPFLESFTELFIET